MCKVIELEAADTASAAFGIPDVELGRGGSFLMKFNWGELSLVLPVGGTKGSGVGDDSRSERQRQVGVRPASARVQACT